MDPQPTALRNHFIRTRDIPRLRPVRGVEFLFPRGSGASVRPGAPQTGSRRRIANMKGAPALGTTYATQTDHFAGLLVRIGEAWRPT